MKPTLPLILLLFASASAEQPPTHNIAVSQLVSSGIRSSEAFSLTTSLRSELGKTGKWQVMERSQMDEILKEQGFQQTGACDEASCAVEMGKVLAVKYMVLGSIGKVGKTFTLNVRLVDVQTGEIKEDITEYEKGSVDALLTNVIPVAARKLAGVPAEAPRRRWVPAAIAGGAVAVAVPVVYLITRKESHSEDPETDLRFRWQE